MAPRKTLSPARRTVVVPSAAPKGSEAAKHAFFYLTSFAALGLLAINLGILLFQIINHFFPEELRGYDLQFSQEMIKFAIAAIVIAAPVYFFVTRTINRHISKKDLELDSGIRKWLTYIVLFLAIGTVIGDLVAAIYSLLNGELTVRFLLKVLTILVIAGAIFLYYFTDIKNKDEASRRRKNNTWTGVFCVLVLLPFLGGIFLIENPQTTRLKRLDAQTVNNLDQVSSSIHSFFSQRGSLPESLDMLMNSPQYYFPEYELKQLQEKNFRYTSTGTYTYELCADFERDNRQDAVTDNYYSYAYQADGWKHPEGNFCFPLEVNPNEYTFPTSTEVPMREEPGATAVPAL